MAFSKYGLVWVAILSVVLLFLVRESEADGGISTNAYKCGRIWIPGCIKPCKKNKCKRICTCEECERDSKNLGKCWKKKPRKMKCDCRKCDTLSCNECQCSSCGCYCKGKQAWVLSIAQSAMSASSFAAVSAKDSATAYSYAAKASHAALQISGKVTAISQIAASISVNASASALTVLHALSTAKCQCDHPAMANAIAAATACASSSASASAMAWAAARGYAKAATKASASAKIAAKASAEALACARTSAYATDLVPGTIVLIIGGFPFHYGCNRSTVTAKRFAYSASELMAEAKACARTVARIKVKAKKNAAVAVSLVPKVETQVQLALSAQAKASACASATTRAMLPCNKKCTLP